MTKTFNVPGATVKAVKKASKKVTPVSTLPLPAIGQGACYSVGSDRYPATVIATTAKTVTVQEATATPAEGHEYFGSQKYNFSPNPNGSIMTARWSAKRQAWKLNTGSYISFNGYGAYSDPSF